MCDQTLDLMLTWADSKTECRLIVLQVWPKISYKISCSKYDYFPVLCNLHALVLASLGKACNSRQF